MLNIDFSKVNLKKEDREILTYLYLDPIYIAEEAYYGSIIDSSCIEDCIANIFYKYSLAESTVPLITGICDCNTCRWELVRNGKILLDGKNK